MFVYILVGSTESQWELKLEHDDSERSFQGTDNDFVWLNELSKKLPLNANETLKR